MKHWSRPSVNAGSAPEALLAGPGARLPPAPGPAGADLASTMEDTVLVQRARAGDEGAFRALHERYAPMVHAVLLARAPRQDADDLLQEVFLAAWRALAQLRSDEHLGGWLAAIARHTSARAWRRAGMQPDSLDAPREHGAARGADDIPDPRPARDDSDELLAVLRELPEAYRETLAMRLVEGLTGPQIARATGLTHGSVRVNLVRGMKLLKDALREKGWP